MELFAVLTAREERGEDILHGLRIALDKIRNYCKIHAIFDQFYSPSSSPPVIKGQPPLLMDPAYLLSPDVHKYFDQLASLAAVTLDRLNVSERCGRMVPELISPQPNGSLPPL